MLLRIVISSMITMMMLLFFVICIVYAGIGHAQHNKSTNVICYYVNSYGVSLAPPEQLDANLCTHILYAFANLNASGYLEYNRKIDIDEEMYKRVANLKTANPELKILLSVAGDKHLFASVAANETTRENLAKSAVNFCKSYGFDGLDIDWELPGRSDSDNFVLMLKDLRSALDEENWLLTTAVYPYPSDGYNVAEIEKYAHMVHIMCYNYYGPWSSHTGHDSPLFASSLDSSYERGRLNIEASLRHWLDAGLSKEKINVGIPFYGRTFALVDASEHGVHSPISGGGHPATPSYKTVCTGFRNYTYVWDDEQKVPYMYQGKQWLSFENQRSIREKTKYIVSQNVGGIMIWQIGLDDVAGDCGQKQALLRTVHEHLGK
ncbi:unnamed protein product [Phyllotreta striolata]|uniref:GH18 domain-containing protein n=1 Tax=Phyllotreta striolata TaxID=444603 RepID=A0A9N9XTZ4_PHYSR|nr:unnamed protein product [Phyllotreta striolata]